MALKGESAAVVQRHRERLDAMAGELAVAMFGPEGMPWGTKFADLEDDVYEIGQALARRLLGSLVSEQAEGDLPEKEQCCPQCAGETEQGDAEPRVMTTRSGELAWCEPQRICPKCRRAFFPSVEESGD